MTGGPCPDCFRGTVHVGNPTGTIQTIHGLPTYVAQPEGTPKGVIVYIPDAFGWDFVNNRMLADHYAKRGGFLVYLPDFMKGTACNPAVIPLMEKAMKPASWFETIFYKPFYFLKAASIFIPFLIRNRPSNRKSLVFDWVAALRTSPPPYSTSTLKIGAAGFCWGGKFTVLLAQDQPSSRVQRHPEQSSSTAVEPLIDCGFTAHPSFITMPQDIENVNIPLSVAVGNEDMAMKSDDIVKMKEILEVKKKGDHEVVILQGAKHGFGVRTDREDEEQMKHAETAEKQAVDWFTRWLVV